MAEKKVSVKWLASLSDGYTAVEGKYPFEVRPGEVKPWKRLQKYTASRLRHITGMRIQVYRKGEAIRTYNLPSLNISPSGRHKKFKKLLPRIPREFKAQRILHTFRFGPPRGDETFLEVMAIYDGYALSIIVDEQEGTEIWTSIHDIQM